MIGIRDEAAPASPAPSRAPEFAALKSSPRPAGCRKTWVSSTGRARSGWPVRWRRPSATTRLFFSRRARDRQVARLPCAWDHPCDDCGRQLIVSTHTISLQEQIERKDLPLCKEALRRRPGARPVRRLQVHGPRRQVELPLHLEALARPRRAGEPVRRRRIRGAPADRRLGRHDGDRPSPRPAAVPEPRGLGRGERGLVDLLEAQLRLRTLLLPAGARARALPR
jgi:hypothetical protein